MRIFTNTNFKETNFEGLWFFGRQKGSESPSMILTDSPLTYLDTIFAVLIMANAKEESALFFFDLDKQQKRPQALPVNDERKMDIINFIAEFVNKNVPNFLEMTPTHMREEEGYINSLDFYLLTWSRLAAHPKWKLDYIPIPEVKMNP
jgi:hypothetical protein